MARALYLLREQPFDGVFVSAAQLSSLRWVGMRIQSDEILEAIVARTKASPCAWLPVRARA